MTGILLILLKSDKITVSLTGDLKGDLRKLFNTVCIQDKNVVKWVA